MKRTEMIFMIFLVMICFARTSYAADNSGKNTIRRFAMIVGANNGGTDRVRLRYAVSDARSVLDIINKMGGVSEDDSILLVEPDRNTFIDSLKKLNKHANSAKSGSKRVEVIFYYSGHSDEEAILLSGEKVFYREISESIREMPADVRIAILDSCSSGAFTRIKGGKMRSPFLVDSSYDMKGYAFMTSSSMDEASQESERIKGSFFTHYLVSGLRGAADMTQDNRITLTEAYQFAYNETLARTEKTISGPQHPNYNIAMSGTGDVVMTDITKSSAMIVLDRDLSGRLFIRDEKGNLIVELRKAPGRDMQLGLEDGKYSVVNERAGRIYEASVELSSGQQFKLAQDNFKITDKEYAVARGDEKDGEKTKEYRIEPWHFSLFPEFENNKDTIHYYVFNLFGAYSAKLDGFEIGVGPSIVREDVTGLQMTFAVGNYAGKNVKGAQISDIFNYAGGDMKWFQICSVLNYTGYNMTGAQVTGIFNYTGESSKGLQLGGIINHSGKEMKGAQIAGIINLGGEDVKGAQIAGVVNLSGKDVSGMQIAGVSNVNYASQNMKGVQIAGVLNYTEGLIKGTQFSVVNIADDVNGVQLGVINIAKQLNGASIGLVNISENGSIDVVAWGSNLMAANAGVRFRANYIYTILAAGWNNLYDDIDRAYAYGFYIGFHIPAGSLYFNIDAGSVQLDNDEIGSSDKYSDRSAFLGRLIAGLNITGSLSIFAGGGANYIYDENFNDDDGGNDIKHGQWSPLYLAGVQYIFYGKN